MVAFEGKKSEEFVPGQIVCLKSKPEIKGAVVRILHGEPENRYLVFVDGESIPYYASQIRAAEEEPNQELVQLKQFHAYLTSLQIRHPGLSNLYSLNSARIEYIPYQFRPVLKFIKSERPRLLIADSVGVVG